MRIFETQASCISKKYYFFITVLFLSTIFTRVLKLIEGTYKPYIFVYGPVIILILIFLSKSFIKKSRIILAKVDLIIFSYFFLLLLATFNALRFGSLKEELNWLNYGYGPIVFYLLVRLLKFNLNWYLRCLYLYGILASVYIIIEFIFYYINPKGVFFIKDYLITVGNLENNEPPIFYYPLLGHSPKPWGPMFEFSTSGLLIVYCFFAAKYIIDTQVKNFFSLFPLFVMLTAIFLSGSKAAYLLFFILWVIYKIFIFSSHTKNLKTKIEFILKSNFYIIIGVVLFWLVFSFLFSDPYKKYHYFNVMIKEPFSVFYENITKNFFNLLIGCGTDSVEQFPLKMSEVDFFNATARFGLITMILIWGTIIYLIIKYKKSNPIISVLLMATFLFFIHYPIVLKYPFNIIFFTLLGVIANEKISMKKSLQKNNLNILK